MSTSLTTIHLADQDFRDLINAQHDGVTTTCRDLTDTSGIPVVRDKSVTPEASRLVQLITGSRGTFYAEGGSGTEQPSETWIWSGRDGIISAQSQGDDAFVLRAAPATDLYTVVIDALGLQARASPLDDGSDVRIDKKILAAAAGSADGAEAVAEAQRSLGEAVRELHPGIADRLSGGEGRYVSLFSEWNGTQGLRQGPLMFVDTPDGVLLHRKSGMRFMPRHTVTAVPTWAVWEEVVQLLPRPEDFISWANQDQ
ncbi:hypothetical protein [Zhihengliuella halotolerans]|uniref:ESAT-6 protein secretion system EspG family protein n=1 Tax=Zhihengliuella halotolerans TaxID=370736 RepID=A0A4V2GA39_9MICC|nr:hypothetical protein [Zhihengliuella halotolerans]RZU62696.1 hypothetical protein EV380_2298 [Zhihengliuella halotolerans]